MKLSEAIRAGAQRRPQAFGAYRKYLGGETWGSCALGAAWEGFYRRDITKEPLNALARDMKLTFPVNTPWPGDWDAEHWSEKPSCVIGCLLVLNDDVRLTREQIADILEERGL